MSPILILVVGIVAAITIDLAVVWGWRYWRTRRAATAEAALPQPPPRPVNTAFVRLERTGRAVVQGANSLLRLFREEALSDERGRLRVSILVACLVLNASIGYAYAESIMVQGWQLWTWILSSVVAIVVLMPSGRPRLAWSREAWLVLGLTIVSGALRLIALDKFPAGLHGDEGRLADFTLIHVYPEPGMTLFPFRVGLYSQPTLYNYIVWMSMRLFGENLVGLRIASAVAGTLAVPTTYFAVSQFSGRRVALFSAVLMATYHDHIQWSRISLNNIWDTLWIPAMLGFLAWGWSNRWSGGAVLSGIALGLSQYFYAGSKIALFLLPFTAYMLWRGGRDSRRMVVHAAKGLAAALVIAAPILAFAGRAPSLYVERWEVVYFWNDMASSGVGPTGLGWLEMIRDQAFRALAGFTSLTDMTGFYRAGVPLVMGLAGPLFVAGVIWAVLQRQFVPVLWIASSAASCLVLRHRAHTTSPPSRPSPGRSRCFSRGSGATSVRGRPLPCWWRSLPRTWCTTSGCTSPRIPPAISTCPSRNEAAGPRLRRTSVPTPPTREPAGGGRTPSRRPAPAARRSRRPVRGRRGGTRPWR